MNDDKVEQEVERQIQSLKLLIKSCNVSVREMERRLDLGAGSLNRIFSGRIELKVRHVMAIVGELGIEPKMFYRLVYGEDRPEQTLAERIFELLGDRAKPRQEPDRPAGGMQPVEMERWMREMFTRLVAEQQTGKKASPRKPAKRRSRR
jgi:transcriptional regulator with XRE-family HTH domain